ncbi:MAG: hypothetical protein L6406_12620, partial [Desulfobacterales bacterium]|nr:hypothetical protein [Desulfobacterales bacterium]
MMNQLLKNFMVFCAICLMLIIPAIAQESGDKELESKKFTTDLFEGLNELQNGKAIGRHSTLIENPDGTKTIKYKFGPAKNYQTTSGDYKPISTSIAQQADFQRSIAGMDSESVFAPNNFYASNTENTIKSFFPHRFCADDPVIFEIDDYQILFYPDFS